MGLFRPSASTPAKPPALKSRPVRGTVEGQRVRFNAEASTGSTPSFASSGRRSSIFGAHHGGAATGVLPYIPLTRARMRNALLTNGMAKGMAYRLAANIVGKGARTLSLCPDLALRKQINALYEDWVDATRFNHLQFEAVLSAICGGDSFGVTYPRNAEADGLPVGVIVRVYESEQCPVELQRAVPGTNRRIMGGIEFTAVDDPLFYYMYRTHPGDRRFRNADAAELIPINARRVMHLHDPQRPGEVRSLPWLAQALVRLSELDIYEDAQLVKQKISAELTGFLQNKSVGGNEPSGAVMFGDSDAGDDEELGDDEYFEIDSLEAGTFPELPEGMEVNWAPSIDTGSQYPHFVASGYRGAASSVSMPYELATGDLERVKSDRVMKIGRTDFQKVARIWQRNMLSDQLCRPTFRQVVNMAEAEGRIVRTPGMSDFDLHRCVVIPEGWAYTHPLQDAQTDLLLTRSGAQTRDTWAGKLDTSAENVDELRAIELERENRLELVYDSNPAKTGKNGADAKQQQGEADAATIEQENAE